MSIAAKNLDDTPKYQLKSDLAVFCLPSSQKDGNLKFAWANSVCFLFILIGLIGIKAPVIEMKPLSRKEEVVPVIFTPPPIEEQKLEPQQIPEEMESAPANAAEIPTVATVVAANAADASFPVQVEGPVILAPARFAAAPPAVAPRPVAAAPTKPKPVTLNPTGKNSDGGYYPAMVSYPQQALDRREQGNVVVYVIVDEGGKLSSVKVQESSGSIILDRACMDWIKSRYRFPPGDVRHFLVPFEFKIQ